MATKTKPTNGHANGSPVNRIRGLMASPPMAESFNASRSVRKAVTLATTAHAIFLRLFNLPDELSDEGYFGNTVQDGLTTFDFALMSFPTVEPLAIDWRALPRGSRYNRQGQEAVIVLLEMARCCLSVAIFDEDARTAWTEATRRLEGFRTVTHFIQSFAEGEAVGFDHKPLTMFFHRLLEGVA